MLWILVSHTSADDRVYCVLIITSFKIREYNERGCSNLKTKREKEPPELPWEIMNPFFNHILEHSGAIKSERDEYEVLETHQRSFGLVMRDQMSENHYLSERY